MILFFGTAGILLLYMPELFLWRTETLNTIHYYNAEDYASSAQFGQAFSVLLREQLSPNHTLIFLCIGSDRATGDSLGPLIGYKLEQHTGRNYLVYGTLESPVHAKNLATVVEEIHNRHKNPYIPLMHQDFHLNSVYEFLFLCTLLLILSTDISRIAIEYASKLPLENHNKSDLN